MTTPNNHITTGMPVPVPPSVREDIELVESTGLVGMLDAKLVADSLDALGSLSSAAWIRQHQGLYCAGVLVGMIDEVH